MMGRKKKPGVIRTKSGRASVAREALQEHMPALETRARLWGMTVEQAKDPRTSTLVGRMARMSPESGGISEGQYDAAMKYREQREAYRKALSAPDSLVNASRSGIGSEDENDFAKWARRAISTFEATQRAVQQHNTEPSNRQYNLLAALDYVVIRDQALPHMFDPARIAINFLRRYYGYRS